MGLEPGETLGRFEITGLLGKGGMGEVYRARDPKLDREVAIKILPAEFSEDIDRLKRFEREAKMLAALNHSHIGAVYEFDEDNGVHFLVLELIEGESLQERISRGPISIKEAVPLFIQIAEALESAHAKGIIHRDLKPGNFQFTRDGSIKILDFGLARPQISKPRTPASPSEATRLSDPNELTFQGLIVGTPSYMSPEQARGEEVDKRTDIWAFGCCMYEALTGHSPFQADTMADTISQVLDREPDWDALPKDTPWRVRELLARCLEKDPKLRLRDIGDAWVELRKLTTDSGRVGPEANFTAPPGRRRPAATTLGLVLVLALGIGAAWFLFPILNPPEPANEVRTKSQRAPTDAPLIKRFAIDIGVTNPMPRFLPNEVEMAIAPDASYIAFTANMDGAARLYIRKIDRLDQIQVPDGVDARLPFFSPDSRWVAYFAWFDDDEYLMKVPLDEGKPQRLCSITDPFGGSWLPDGRIIFSDDRDADGMFRLYQVPDIGGEAEPLLKTGLAEGETYHIEPAGLPGGDALLFTIGSGDQHTDVALLDLDTLTYEPIIENARAAAYVNSGHLVFVRANGIWAAPFDLEARAITGNEVQLHPEHGLQVFWQNRPFALSAEGSLLFLPKKRPREAERMLVWVSRDGIEETLPLPRAPYFAPRVSPNGERVVMTRSDLENEDIWLHEVQRPGSLTRLTFDPNVDRGAAWMPDSEGIVFGSFRDGTLNMYRRRIDGTGGTVRLHESDRVQAPQGVSMDGGTVLYLQLIPGSGWGLGRYSVEDDTAELLGELEGSQLNGDLSPDGKWIVYTSDEEQEKRVYVRPFPNVADGKWQISTGGGEQPLWSPDGDEIYYRTGNRMMAVAVSTQPRFQADEPVRLFENEYYFDEWDAREYDLEYPDAERFLMVKKLDTEPTTQIIYVDNWAVELVRAVPANMRD